MWWNRISLALLCLEGISSFSRADVAIPLKCRVRGLPEGRCGWCAVETLARYHKIRPLYGLADQHTSRATAADLARALDEANVDYRVQNAGCRNTFILKYAVQEKLGAAVGFRPLRPGGERHMVTLVDFGADEVRVIDPSDSDGRIRTLSRQRFLSWWDGYALILEAAEEVK